MGEINDAIWKQQRVVIKKVNKYDDLVVCSKNFVHEVSSNCSRNETLIFEFTIKSKMNFQYRLHYECNMSDNVIRLLGFTKGILFIFY